MEVTLPHLVTLWRRSGTDGFGGDVVESPILIAARWEDRNELGGDPENRDILIRSVVYSKAVIDEGDWLAQGDHRNFSKPDEVTGASIVRRVVRSRSVDGLVELYKAEL